MRFQPQPPSRALASAPWVIVMGGVVVMVFLLVAAVSCLPAEERSSGLQSTISQDWPYAPGTGPSPEGTGWSTPTPAPVSPDIPSATASQPAGNLPGDGVASLPATLPATTPTRPAPPAQPSPPADPAMTGRYQLIASYQDSFMGEVVVANGSGVARHWTVELRFPADVGELQTFWVESAPQATLSRSGDRYVFTSTATVPAGSTVPLRFNFHRSGASDFPTECRVSGTDCTIR